MKESIVGQGDEGQQTENQLEVMEWSGVLFDDKMLFKRKLKGKVLQNGGQTSNAVPEQQRKDTRHHKQ